MDHHGDIGVLVAVIDHGSFTSAATALGLSTSQVSRRVKALEDRLGARLLERTTRQVRPTAAGQAYRDRVAPLLEALDEAAEAAACQRAAPVGTLRLAVPGTLGRHYLAEPLASFTARWPQVRVEASYSDRLVDLVGEGFDLAIRGGQQLDENLVARRILSFGGVCAASPAYLAARGRPAHPAELAEHACLVNKRLRTISSWAFTRGEEEVRVNATGPLACDDGEALVGAAVAGLGVVCEPDFIVAPALAAGTLVPLLEDWTSYEGQISAVYPNRRYLPGRVRLFIDHLVEAWAEPPWASHCPRRRRAD